MPRCPHLVRRRLRTGISLALVVALEPAVASSPAPAALTALLSAQGISRPVMAWCQGEFRDGRPGGFAVALQAADGGGTYAVVEPKAAIVELGTYVQQPSIDCYTRAEADTLDDTIRRSTTIHGRVRPRWNTSVVCAFSDATSATCWQYSPVDRAFVRVGQWVT
jgi:hypothetical protein